MINKTSLMVLVLLCVNENNGNFKNWIFPIIKNDNKIITGKIIFKSNILKFLGFKINSFTLFVGSNFNFSNIIEQIVIADIGLGNQIK